MCNRIVFELRTGLGAPCKSEPNRKIVMALEISTELYEMISKITEPQFLDRIRDICKAIGLKSVDAIRGVSSGTEESFWKITSSFLTKLGLEQSEDFEVIKFPLLNYG